MFKTEKVFVRDAVLSDQVGNLAPTVDTRSLTDYFTSYGAVHDCVVMMNRDATNRGFGFCEFTQPGAVDRVMADWQSHFIDGQVSHVSADDSGLR